MLKRINHKLNDLARPLDFISEVDAKNAVNAVCRKVKEVIDDVYIVDVYWKKDGDDGMYVLDPLVSVRSDFAEKARMIIISEDIGVLPWVQKKRKAAWIDDVRKKNWNEPVLNLAAVDLLKDKKNENIDSDSDDKFIMPSKTINNFSHHTGCIMAYPLHYRNEVWGVLSIELTRPKKYDLNLNRELFNMAGIIASLIWKADLERQNAAETKDAVDEFVAIITRQEDDEVDLTQNPSGFMARPFDKEGVFDQVENDIQNCIPFVEINHFNDQGRELIISKIKKQIQKAHFCIVDITGLNVNVMIELGMMMNDRDKRDKTIIIQNCKNTEKTPFDINQHPVYHYLYKDKSLYIKDSGGGKDKLFKPILADLINDYVRESQ